MSAEALVGAWRRRAGQQTSSGCPPLAGNAPTASMGTVGMPSRDYAQISPEELARLYRDGGDERALSELRGRFWPLYRNNFIKCRYPRAPDEFEAAFDDKLMAAVAEYDEHRGWKFSTFLATCVGNGFRDVARRLKRLSEHERPDPDPENQESSSRPSPVDHTLPALVEEAMERERRNHPESHAILRLLRDEFVPRPFYRHARRILAPQYDKPEAAWRNIKARNVRRLQDFLREHGYGPASPDE